MADARQQMPKNKFTTITLPLSRSIHRLKTLDVMAQAGYSKTFARELIRKNYVWQPSIGGGALAMDYPNYWLSVMWDCWVCFYEHEYDYVLVVQPGPGYEYWGGRHRWKDATVIKAIRG